MSEKHEHRWVAQPKVGARWSRCCGGWGSCGVVEEVTQGEWEALVGEEKKRAEAEGWRPLNGGLPTSEERVVRAVVAVVVAATQRMVVLDSTGTHLESEDDAHARLLQIGLAALKGGD